MTANIEPGKGSVIPEPEVQDTAKVEKIPTEPLPTVARDEFPRGNEDRRVNDEALGQFQYLKKDYQQPRSKISIYQAIPGSSVIAFTQETFDKWVKAEAEQTKKQIEKEREEKRLKKEKEEMTNDRLYEMKEVQEMKKQIMSFYVALTKK